MYLLIVTSIEHTRHVASKRKVQKRRRGASLRLPSTEAKTPAKVNWGSKPLAKVNAETTA